MRLATRVFCLCRKSFIGPTSTFLVPERRYSAMPCPSKLAPRYAFYMYNQSIFPHPSSLHTVTLSPPSHQPTNPRHLPSPINLVRPSRLLARLQLLQIPATDRHIALVLIHAAREALHVRGTRTLALLRLRRARLTIIIPLIRRWLRVGILGRLLLLSSTTTAAEPAADGVSDRGTDCDSSVQRIHISTRA